MLDFNAVSLIALRAAAASVLAVILVLALREIRRQDSRAATIVACGLLARAAIGAGLFWVSYLDLPVLSSLHTGDGFWHLAPDARQYFETAARATGEGLRTIPPSSASPAFTRLLTVWMWAVGVSPASGLFLNLLLFTVSSWLVVSVFRERSRGPVLHLLLAAHSFVPAAVLYSVQGLKDQLVLALVICVCCGMWLATSSCASADMRMRSLATTLIVFSVYLLGGIRAYFSLLTVLAYGAAAMPSIWQVQGMGPRLRRAAVKFAVVLLLWTAFAVGAGPYYSQYESLVADALGLGGVPRLSSLLRTVEGARQGFVRSGGETNIAPPVELTGADAVGEPVRPRQATERLLLGIAVLFVPIDIVRWTGEVSLRGGRGLLLITDVDTIAILLVTILAMGGLRRRGAAIFRDPYVVFCVLLAVVTLGLMAYVVTNYGTLFRLRLFPLMALWMAPLGIDRRALPGEGSPGEDGSVGGHAPPARELISHEPGA
jgi:hypothetical protein